jgi:mRNA interferase MazF
MRRGEIWLISLDPTVGAELQKTRPAIIVSSDAIGVLPLRVVVPITDWKEHYELAEWMVKIIPNTTNCLTKPSAVDTFQIRSVSTARFVRKTGDVSIEEMDMIVEAIRLVIEFS